LLLYSSGLRTGRSGF